MQGPPRLPDTDDGANKRLIRQIRNGGSLLLPGSLHQVAAGRPCTLIKWALQIRAQLSPNGGGTPLPAEGSTALSRTFPQLNAASRRTTASTCMHEQSLFHRKGLLRAFCRRGAFPFEGWRLFGFAEEGRGSSDTEPHRLAVGDWEPLPHDDPHA